MNKTLPLYLLVGLLALATVLPACREKKELTGPAAELAARRIPRDVVVYPGGREIEWVQDAAGSFQLRLLTPATSEEVAMFYEKHLRPVGWNLIGTNTPGLTIYKKQDRLFEIALLPTEDPDLRVLALNYKVP